MWRRYSARMCWLYAAALLGIVTFSMVRPGVAQNTCTTNYCVKSQSISFQTPSGWPSVTIQTCCHTRWGVLPNGMDWSNGTPVMLCTGNANYATEYPNCGAPSDLSQDFPLAYENPKIGIGVAWPNAKDYRYEVESIPIIDSGDGSCAHYSGAAGKMADWWTYELREPKRGSYVFRAVVSFRQSEKGYYAVLANCQLTAPSSN
jgi:hypothetical protein